MEWLGWLAVAAVALVGIDRLGLFAERRGWIYWRKVKPRSMAGAVSGVVDEAFQPNRVHYVQEQRSQRRQADDQGAGGRP